MPKTYTPEYVERMEKAVVNANIAMTKLRNENLELKNRINELEAQLKESQSTSTTIIKRSLKNVDVKMKAQSTVSARKSNPLQPNSLSSQIRSVSEEIHSSESKEDVIIASNVVKKKRSLTRKALVDQKGVTSSVSYNEDEKSRLSDVHAESNTNKNENGYISSSSSDFDSGGDDWLASLNADDNLEKKFGTQLRGDQSNKRQRVLNQAQNSSNKIQAVDPFEEALFSWPYDDQALQIPLSNSGSQDQLQVNASSELLVSSVQNNEVVESTNFRNQQAATISASDTIEDNASFTESEKIIINSINEEKSSNKAVDLIFQLITDRLVQHLSKTITTYSVDVVAKICHQQIACLFRNISLSKYFDSLQEITRIKSSKKLEIDDLLPKDIILKLLTIMKLLVKASDSTTNGLYWLDFIIRDLRQRAIASLIGYFSVSLKKTALSSSVTNDEYTSSVVKNSHENETANISDSESIDEILQDESQNDDSIVDGFVNDETKSQFTRLNQFQHRRRVSTKLKDYIYGSLTDSNGLADCPEIEYVGVYQGDLVAAGRSYFIVTLCFLAGLEHQAYEFIRDFCIVSAVDPSMKCGAFFGSLLAISQETLVLSECLELNVPNCKERLLPWKDELVSLFSRFIEFWKNNLSTITWSNKLFSDVNVSIFDAINKCAEDIVSNWQGNESSVKSPALLCLTNKNAVDAIEKLLAVLPEEEEQNQREFSVALSYEMRRCGLISSIKLAANNPITTALTRQQCLTDAVIEDCIQSILSKDARCETVISWKSIIDQKLVVGKSTDACDLLYAHYKLYYDSNLKMNENSYLTQLSTISRDLKVYQVVFDTFLSTIDYEKQELSGWRVVDRSSQQLNLCTRLETRIKQLYRRGFKMPYDLNQSREANFTSDYILTAGTMLGRLDVLIQAAGFVDAYVNNHSESDVAIEEVNNLLILVLFERLILVIAIKVRALMNALQITSSLGTLNEHSKIAVIRLLKQVINFLIFIPAPWGSTASSQISHDILQAINFCLNYYPIDPFHSIWISQLSMKIPIFTINLSRRKDRWGQTIAACTQNGFLPFRIDAVDGIASSDILNAQIPHSDVVKTWNSILNNKYDSFCLPNQSMQMTTSERACAASHLKTWRLISNCFKDLPNKPKNIATRSSPIDTIKTLMSYMRIGGGWPKLWNSKGAKDTNVKQDWFLILEDDATITRALLNPSHLHIKNMIFNVISKVPVDCDILYLGHQLPSSTDNQTGKGNPSKNGIFTKVDYVWSLHAYVLKISTIDVLLSNLPLDAPVDCFIARLIHDKHLVAYVLNEPLFKQAGKGHGRFPEGTTKLNLSDIEHSGLVYGRKQKNYQRSKEPE